MAKEKQAKKETKEDASAEAKKPAKKARGKKRIVQTGNVYVQASYNNTIVSITDPNGNLIASGSAGASGFKGARKATPYAAQVSAEKAAEKAKVFGLEKINVFVNGVGTGREQSVRGLVSSGLEILTISDVTPIPHNGCRSRKARRV